IGGSQTGVYPVASPGGWQIIGGTELSLFRAGLNPPTLLAAGDPVRFVAEKVEPLFAFRQCRHRRIFRIPDATGTGVAASGMPV
ncbi:hypothetical protein CWI53_08870, partial [Neisseria meningitidis]